jgi:hypothetical protein
VAAPVYLRRVIAVLLAASCFFNAALAKRPSLFTGADVTNMRGMKTLIERITAAAAARRQNGVRYVIPEIGEFHFCAFSNTLIYEYGGTPRTDGSIQLPSGIRYSVPHADVFFAPTRGSWNRSLPGGDDAQKMDRLISMAMQEPDYLLLPTERSLDFLERRRADNFMNLKVRELKRRLLGAGAWTPIGGPIAITPDESIELYARKPHG